MVSYDDVAEALETGGVFEEAFEFLQSELWEDEWQREMLLQTMLTNQLLVNLNQKLDSIPPTLEPPAGGGGDGGAGGATPPEDITSGIYDQPREDAQYWVSDGKIPVTNTDSFYSETWGFTARTVVLFFNDDIDIAFVTPEEDENKIINLPESRSPFSISGVFGLFTDRVYYRQNENASGTPELEILALW